MSEVESKVARGGARAARRAARSAPLPDSLRPVRPGMPGGRYKPLEDSDVLRIHHAALDVLEKIGLADATPSGIDYMTKAGAVLNSAGRLIFPRALVEDTVARAARHFVLHGQDPKHDMEPWGSRVYFGTAGAAVHIVDAKTGDYRDSTTKDLYDIARVVDTLEHLHFYQRSVVCREVATPLEMDINTAYASVAGTTKHVGTSWVQPQHVEASLEMFHLDGGRRGQVACAPVRQPVQLLRRAPAQVRLRCVSLPRDRGARRNAGSAAVRGPSRRDGARRARLRARARSGRVPGGSGVRQCDEAGCDRDLRYLVLRVGSSYRRDVGRQP